MLDDACGCGKCQHNLCARRVPIFSALDDEEITKVVSLITRRQYKKGEIVLMEGDLSRSLIIINKGKIKTFSYTPDGREQILYIFSEGDFFGEMNLIAREESTYNAQALEDTNTCVIGKADFQKLLMKYPQIALRVMEELCTRLEKMEGMVRSMGSGDIEFRVNMVLLEFSKKYGREHPRGKLIELPLSREGIANYIGVARETVSRKLSYLQDEGIIEMIGNKKIILLDEKALERSV